MMLIALLYGLNEQLIAAAPACDVTAAGELYWTQCHAAKIEVRDVGELAFLAVDDFELRSQLFQLGIDDAVDPASMTAQVNRLIGLTAGPSGNIYRAA